ncbi:hypothetical protein ACIGXI_31875 [Kitasatospora aureofaciens]|uniref:hypothetical protein n=1 Tax=Kitasatospora aureofaciens TaxID=1894 RepID=UPI0037CC399B
MSARRHQDGGGRRGPGRASGPGGLGGVGQGGGLALPSAAAAAGGRRQPGRAAARQELRAERERERAAGRLAGTRDLVVARALRAELIACGWDGQWSAPSPGAIGPGRRWGSTAARYQHAEGAARFEASLTIRLPVALAEQLQRAVYWQSSAIEHRLRLLAGRAEHRDEVQPLQADLVTTGDVLRAAVRRAAAEPVPALAKVPAVAT